MTADPPATADIYGMDAPIPEAEAVPQRSLVESLRELADDAVDPDWPGMIMREAADRIAELEAENKRLRCRKPSFRRSPRPANRSAGPACQRAGAAMTVYPPATGDIYGMDAPIPEAEASGIWKLVPVEPTEVMVDAGVVASERQSVSAIYRAMLAATPPAPRLIPPIRDLIALAEQYRSDMLHPPAEDSRRQRVERIDDVLRRTRT